MAFVKISYLYIEKEVSDMRVENVLYKNKREGYKKVIYHVPYQRSKRNKRRKA